jgi:phenylacetate-coenzyme A ligase PaaK-like adenylate-forming protein
MDRIHLLQKIIAVTPTTFDQVALAIFRYQAQYNSIYRQFIEILGIEPDKIQDIHQIPFLPIPFFKTHEIKTGQWQTQTIFTSSGTTGQTPSQHLVKDINWYLTNSVDGFEEFYGSVQDYCILALLPSYLERKGSSLIKMVEYFIQQSKYQQSGFYLYNHEELIQHLKILNHQNIPTLLIGVSFALWELAENFPTELKNIIFMETGGMKGKREEITRTALHQILKNAFQVNSIHSEYGMTELLSQAYSKGNGLFECSKTMKIITKEITDPFTSQKIGKSGTLNIIDLANIDTCSFIATQDVGRVYEDNRFEILGRLDVSDIRGCNLMILND